MPHLLGAAFVQTALKRDPDSTGAIRLEHSAGAMPLGVGSSLFLLPPESDSISDLEDLSDGPTLAVQGPSPAL